MRTTSAHDQACEPSLRPQTSATQQFPNSRSDLTRNSESRILGPGRAHDTPDTNPPRARVRDRKTEEEDAPDDLWRRKSTEVLDASGSFHRHGTRHPDRWRRHSRRPMTRIRSRPAARPSPRGWPRGAVRRTGSCGRSGRRAGPSRPPPRRSWRSGGCGPSLRDGRARHPGSRMRAARAAPRTGENFTTGEGTGRRPDDRPGDRQAPGAGRQAARSGWRKRTGEALRRSRAGERTRSSGHARGHAVGGVSAPSRPQSLGPHRTPAPEPPAATPGREPSRHRPTTLRPRRNAPRGSFPSHTHNCLND